MRSSIPAGSKSTNNRRKTPIMTSLAAGRSLDAAAARAYGPYPRRVRANRRRLGS